MALVNVLTALATMRKLANEAGRGNLKATNTAIRNLDAGDRALQSQINRTTNQIKVGTLICSGASTNITIGSNWTPDALLLARHRGSAMYLGTGAIGDGQAVFVRTQTNGGGASMGLIASLGIYLQSNGFGLGSTLAVNAKSYGYIAFRSGPTDV